VHWVQLWNLFIDNCYVSSDSYSNAFHAIYHGSWIGRFGSGNSHQYSFAMISAVLCETFGMCPVHNRINIKKPRLRLCFDKNTMIAMANGQSEPIETVQVGEKTKDSGIITAKFCLDATDVDMYDLDGVQVSGSHRVKYEEEWILSNTIPEAFSWMNTKKL
jgi:hypothetical protein